jgi:hypothetical protein
MMLDKRTFKTICLAGRDLGSQQRLEHAENRPSLNWNLGLLAEEIERHITGSE